MKDTKDNSFLPFSATRADMDRSGARYLSSEWAVERSGTQEAREDTRMQPNRKHSGSCSSHSGHCAARNMSRPRPSGTTSTNMVTKVTSAHESTTSTAQRAM